MTSFQTTSQCSPATALTGPSWLVIRLQYRYQYYILWCHELTHWQNINHYECDMWILFSSSKNFTWRRIVLQLAIKPLHFLLTDILTVAQVAVISYHSTGAGRTRMQLAKVVITSILILVASAEGWPEGKDCVLKYIADVKILLLSVALNLFAVCNSLCVRASTLFLLAVISEFACHGYLQIKAYSTHTMFA